MTIEYMTTGELAAKLIAEGKNTGCDIIYDLEYNYMLKLDESGGLADVSELCNENDFCEDTISARILFRLTETSAQLSLTLNC